MNQSEIAELFAKLARLTAAAESNSGSGTAWTVTSSEGVSTRYEMVGLKSHEDVRDAAGNLLIWIWNTKDYLKHWVEDIGGDPQEVEDHINGEPALCVCGDLANLLKHSRLDRPSRSGRAPSIGEITLTIPQTAVKSISFGGSEQMDVITTEIGDSGQVVVRLPVFLDGLQQTMDAFEYAAAGIESWQSLVAKYPSR